jgi:hypothetical protein
MILTTDIRAWHVGSCMMRHGTLLHIVHGRRGSIHTRLHSPDVHVLLKLKLLDVRQPQFAETAETLLTWRKGRHGSARKTVPARMDGICVALVHGVSLVVMGVRMPLADVVNIPVWLRDRCLFESLLEILGPLALVLGRRWVRRSPVEFVEDFVHPSGVEQSVQI